ncbi:TlpA family protein disulfide reductase [Chitinophaga qingshengii]|uniref:TlpA family protein disulfide reductase n=1 Tax=Chitinophaga qingshengii TaxID=1569794 RepID=A0ABR7TKE3_9BACT|nr:TlpA disulfide reductase family protein [Chitinophaga qingshengii]MBC9930130.1 TlpA family protein disulfide reductase [Chitinophaga qingshengii]
MLSIRMQLTCAILLFFFPLTVCAQSGLPILEAGSISVKGQVVIPGPIKKDSVWLLFQIPQPFTGESRVYRTLLDSAGRYTLKVNTETNISRCAVSTDIDITNQVIIFLKSGQENTVSFEYNNDKIINKVKTSYNAGFSEEELLQSLNKFVEMIDERSGKPIEPLYNKEYSAFIDHTNNVLQRKRGILNKPFILSEKMKEIVFKDYSLAVYYNHVFDYQTEMVLNYRNTNDHRMPDSAEIKKPVRKDYAFLKNLDLNNRLYLYCFSYPTFTQELLKNNILNIPRIQDTPIQEWTKNVKVILGQLIGFDQGIFYDMLVGNAYAMQFELEVKPLTPKQIENIKKYYKGGNLEKILLRKNQEIVQQSQLKESLVINNTPAVSPEALMNAIISRYKGKVVIVDFWATWCVPCLEAIRTSRNSKKQLAGKGAIFVYISSPSSPRKLWESQIQGIGGQQYYLTTEQWKFLMDSYNFNGIPSYLIFDKNGELKQRFTAYPGNEAMQKKIETVLESE